MVSALKKNYSRQARVVVALVLALALAFPPLGPLFVTKANAAPLTNFKVLVNNSQASATGVTYTMQFTISDPAQQIKQVNVDICTTASGTCNAPAGFDTGGASATLANENLAGTGNTTTSSDANSFIDVVTTPSAQSTTTVSMTWTGVTNPSTADTTFYARATTYSDTGTTVLDGTSVAAFAILTSSSIAVSATVDTSFTFSVAGVASGGNLNGGTGNIDETATATTIPFGTLTVGTDEVVAHDLTVSTNAANGYQITASHAATLISGNPPLASGSANIDTFSSGTNASPVTWSEPNGTTANSDTGFFGYTTEDATLCNGTVDRFTNGGAKWAGTTLVGSEVVCSSVPVASQTTRVGWAVEVNGYQPPGLYTGTVILIATPTY